MAGSSMDIQHDQFQFPASVCVMGGGKTGCASVSCLVQLIEALTLSHAPSTAVDDRVRTHDSSDSVDVPDAHTQARHHALALRFGIAHLKRLDFYPGEGTCAPALQKRFSQAGVRVFPHCVSPHEQYDLCITSPGISPLSDFYQAFAAVSREMIGEPELAWRLSPQNWLAITGTNGKTTTTTLVRDMLRAAGMKVTAVGNIGECCIDHVLDRSEDEWFAAEMSSFQLEETRYFHPAAAALLNITADHLEWHGTFEAYAHAKEKIFAHLEACDTPILSRDDAWCDAIYQRLCDRGLDPVCIDIAKDPGTPRAAYCKDNRLYVRLDSRSTFCVGELSRAALKGDHNTQNMLAAAACALSAGVPTSAITEVLYSFKSLEHRLEYVATKRDIAFVNDSKATNPASVLKALSAFDPDHIVLLLGGHDKHTDLSQFAQEVVRKCRVAVCFGAAAARFEEALQEAQAAALHKECALQSLHDARGRLRSHKVCQLMRASQLKDAFEQALGVAQPGDTILLSPACSSFDEFHNMAERGRYFKELVNRL